ncbi:hypothetical protein [Polynucleobacter sphagniphilus]|uniref:hypothetical protein n=1 Tax=Polynucleobacter sphagniphilus TaxID=1743169 RepID=UPI00247718A7|nr:hypothetical protein [Polynucleobacter sphagniphilus]MDH6525581.1 hypothetical protein [Polynucleobacter sphagniphilus]
MIELNMKVLFIGLDYHSYTKSIISELEIIGSQVDWVDIQPRSLFFKFFHTINSTLFNKYLNYYHLSKILQSSTTSYDKVLFLQTHQMSLFNLQLLRKIHSQAEFILYNWDSILNHDYRQHAKYFDRVLTFDRLDAIEYGYAYLPLFCQRSMQGLLRNRGRTLSLYTVGNIVKPARYSAINLFRDYCRKHGIEFRDYLKISPVVFILLLKSRILPKGIKLREIEFERFIELIEISSAVFDFSNHSQSGQTMRMIENVCCGKKIITNNVWVREEKFYSQDRIYIFNDLDFTGVEEFLKVPLVDPAAEFPEYHIQSFVRQLLGIDGLLNDKFSNA